VVPGALEECGFGVIDWRALPRRVTVELLRAADRIARDDHAVAFTGRRYRAGPELRIDGRLTVTRHLSGQPGPTATADAAVELLIATLMDLAGPAGSARHIAVVSGQPEFSKQDAAEAVTRWQRSQRSNADFHASRLPQRFLGEFEVESAAVPPGDGGVGGQVGLAEDG